MRFAGRLFAGLQPFELRRQRRDLLPALPLGGEGDDAGPAQGIELAATVLYGAGQMTLGVVAGGGMLFGHGGPVRRVRW